MLRDGSGGVMSLKNISGENYCLCSNEPMQFKTILHALHMHTIAFVVFSMPCAIKTGCAPAATA